MDKKTIALASFLAIFGITLITVGLSYAFFSYAKTGTTENVIKSGSISFLYDEINREGNSISIIDALPVDSDEEEKSNNNYFDFRIESASNIVQIPYTVTAKLSDDTTLDLDIIKVYLTELVGTEETPILYTTLDQLQEVTFKDGELELYKDTVPVGTNYDRKFRLRMWMAEETNFISGAYDNKKLSLTVNVYTNQGTKLTEENLTKPNDTRIKMISGNNTYLLNESSEENIDYEVTVPNEVNTIDLDVVTRNVAATSNVEEIGPTLSYNDGYIKRMTNSSTYNLLTGDNYFKVKVTSADGTKTTNYNIKVFRELSKDNTLTYLGVEGYSFTETFDKDTLSYEVVGLEVDKVTLTGNKGNEAASISGLGEKTLNWGENTFKVTVTPEDPTISTRTYTIVVNKIRPEAPGIEASTNDWTSTNPVISIASPGTAISGVDHYEVYETQGIDLPNEETVATSTTDNEYTVTTNGISKIYYRTVSENGHKSLWSEGVEVKIDKNAPTAVAITASDSKASDAWHTADYTLNISATKNGGSNLTYYYGTSSNPTTSGSSITVNTNTNGTTYYAKACNEAGVCSDNATYIAKLDTNTYTISYTLNSGSVSGNPTTYQVTTSAITLKNPTRLGYNFSGWTGSNGTTAQTTVTIASGSQGNKEYTANWSAKSITCTAGNYLPANSETCTKCTAGSACSGGTWTYDGTAKGIAACGAGKYSAAGASSCSNINAGCYGTSATSACPASCSGRTKYSAKGSSSCSTVSTGYYTTGCNSSGNNCTGQAKCAAGSYCTNGISNACSGRTKYSGAGATSCSTVSTGYYTTGCNSSGNNCTGQTKCAAGNYCTNGVSNACGGGKYSGAGATSCSNISAGCYGTSASSACPASCSGRTKYSGAGASSCSTVSSGYYTTGCNSSGNKCTGQAKCAAGTYCSGGVSYNCATGYSSSAGATSCSDTTGPTINWPTTSTTITQSACLAAPISGGVHGISITDSGSGFERGKVEVYYNGTKTTEAVTDAYPIPGFWCGSNCGCAPGNYTFTQYAWDKAGNQSVIRRWYAVTSG